MSDMVEQRYCCCKLVYMRYCGTSNWQRRSSRRAITLPKEMGRSCYHVTHDQDGCVSMTLVHVDDLITINRDGGSPEITTLYDDIGIYTGVEHA